MPAHVNLADLYREEGRDADGERVLRRALALEPASADAHHALGLLLVRQKRSTEALAELAKAAERDPERARFAYVYAVALDGFGQPAEALRVLQEAQRRFTGDRDILAALAHLTAKSGDLDAA